jgi:hypothetical protein
LAQAHARGQEENWLAWKTGELTDLMRLFVKTKDRSSVACVAAAFEWRKAEPKLRFTGTVQA